MNNKEINPFIQIVKKISDNSLQDIYSNLIKINPLDLLKEDNFCKAIVNEWHYRVDPKH
jgi:hypothetical protein